MLLNGFGADELLGGYSRHKTAFLGGGWKALANEVSALKHPCQPVNVLEQLQLDLDRIPNRNLGRDDRVISSHGKEVRHPFLASEVIALVSTLPLDLKADLRLPLGVGDKLLLRLGAYRLGMVKAAVRKKRAMQFGSHSARMEGGERHKRGDYTVMGVYGKQ